MSSALRRLVTERASGFCEYCRIHCDVTIHRHHVEHIVARQHGGSSELANLALACHHCNEFKGPNLTGIDPETGRVCRLFHPRKDEWDHHFEITEGNVVGITMIGRTTARLFRMNETDRVLLRELS